MLATSRETNYNDIIEKPNRRFSPGFILSEDNTYVQLYNHFHKTNYQNANEIPALTVDIVKHLLYNIDVKNGNLLHIFDDYYVNDGNLIQLLNLY